jgi:predicted ATPase/DNA-binding winged helix-turn-helix (wHTH) protein
MALSAAMDLTFEMPVIIEFGRFRIVPHRRELLADGRPLNLGARTFDVLMALIEGQGAVVSKAALKGRVWPNRIVEENALQVQISALRDAFGADRNLIRTISRRGYQFIGEIRTVAARPHTQAVAGTAVPMPASPRPPTNLPEPISELIGRDDELAEILGLTAAHRLVTLVGPGGIGKTRLSSEVARHLLPRFADGVWVAELAPLSDPGLVPATVATALGVEVSGGAVSMERLADALGRKQLMLVLDNCEHVVDAAAQTTEALLRGNPATRVIATSREPLRAEGEWVFPVPPLAVPNESNPSREDPLRYGSVRLFVERARAVDPRFSFDERVAEAISAICRRLDGIPLAIELAAARASALGIKELASRLDTRFDLLVGGKRTALPRHRTLRATLDWSYGLLPEIERMILRRLSVFAGSFTLEAAKMVAVSTEITGSDVVDCIGNLIAKSLVGADLGDAKARYRLLETTRNYALDKLNESGEHGDVARRHAEYYRDLFRRTTGESETRSAAETRAVYGRDIDNVRAALDWAFSPAGDPSVGVALTISSVPHWFQFSRIEEYRGRVERALASLGSGSGQDAHPKMQLLLIHAELLRFVKGRAHEAVDSWEDALKLGEYLDENNYRLQALQGLWAYFLNSGGVWDAIGRAEQYFDLAANASDPADQFVGDLMIGMSRHYLGDQTNARRHIERMLVGYPDPAPASHMIRFYYEQRSLARAVLARVLWLQGLPDQAMHVAWSIAESAQSQNHVPTACRILAMGAFPVALRVGDLAAAEHFLAIMLDRSAGHVLDRYVLHFGRCLEGMLLIKQGNVISGLEHLRTGTDELRDTGFTPDYTTFLGAIAEGLAGVGRVVEGLASIEEAIARSLHRGQLWCLADLLRIKGALILGAGARSAVSVAEDHFLQGLELARRQGARSWELRCATSLARLWRDQARSKEARELLAPVYDRFTEGFATADLRAAKALLEELCSKNPARSVGSLNLEFVPVTPTAIEFGRFAGLAR